MTGNQPDQQRLGGLSVSCGGVSQGQQQLQTQPLTEGQPVDDVLLGQLQLQLRPLKHSKSPPAPGEICRLTCDWDSVSRLNIACRVVTTGVRFSPHLSHCSSNSFRQRWPKLLTKSPRSRFSLSQRSASPGEVWQNSSRQLVNFLILPARLCSPFGTPADSTESDGTTVRDCGNVDWSRDHSRSGTRSA